MSSQPGKFITVEGLDGVGKSTIVKLISSWLNKKSIRNTVTREPGGTPIAEEIRGLLLKDYEEAMCADTELLLMFAGRAQHINRVILPALNQGSWVISDRFTDSSFAYQGGGRGVSFLRIAELAEWVHGNLQPDLTILLDAPVKVGFERMKKREKKDRIEEEGTTFFNNVRAMYLNMAYIDPQRFRIVDARQSLPDVEKSVYCLLESLLKGVC